ncbi:hypothetical protein BC832DRAFT_592170 [Gaertneriomyces semiglobifer]|nr:hypothetical protein BC832DRAFT_592170 [Gaertneriomyces semiglobifer]
MHASISRPSSLDLTEVPRDTNPPYEPAEPVIVLDDVGTAVALFAALESAGVKYPRPQHIESTVTSKSTTGRNGHKLGGLRAPQGAEGARAIAGTFVRSTSTQRLLQAGLPLAGFRSAQAEISGADLGSLAANAIDRSSGQGTHGISANQEFELEKLRLEVARETERRKVEKAKLLVEEAKLRVEVARWRTEREITRRQANGGKQ